MIFDAIHSKVNILDNVQKKSKDKKFIILITMVWFF